MKLRRIAFLCLLMAFTGVWVAGGAFAVPNRVDLLNDPVNHWGWQTHSLKCWNGKGGILSYYNPGARGNGGPAPASNLGFECPENGSAGGGDQPGQSWTGTDRYTVVGPAGPDDDQNGHELKIRDIKKINYWAILDWAGINTFPLVDGNGCDVYHEWRLQSQASQPPHVVLTVKLSSTSTDWRKMIYRPWGTKSAVYGFGPSAVEFNATGAARLHRIWQNYNAVDTIEGNYDGCWYVTESADVDHPTGMYTWPEILAKYPDAVLATPSIVQNPVFFSDPAQAPIPCSFSLHLGAMDNTNSDWASVGKSAWWYESYWARGAADLVTFAYDADPTEGESIVEEQFDFEAGAEKPTAEYALNNLAVFDQTVYMPNPRTRKSVKPTEPLDWGEGTVLGYKMNAPQRYGHYGTNFRQYWNGTAWATVTGTTEANQFVVYGQVCADPAPETGVSLGKWFYLDDGAGKKIKVYCPGGLYDTRITEGNYLRCVGSLHGNNPYEWFWNNFHIIVWRPTFPDDCPQSQPWPWEFQTYTWKITQLYP